MTDESSQEIQRVKNMPSFKSNKFLRRSSVRHSISNFSSINLKKINKETNFDEFINILKTPSKFRNEEEIEKIKHYLVEHNILEVLEKNKTNEIDKTILLECFSNFMEYLPFKNKEIIFRIDDPADKFFLILKGKCEVFVPEKIKIFLTKQEYFQALEKLLYDAEVGIVKLCLNSNYEKISFENFNDFFDYAKARGKIRLFEKIRMIKDEESLKEFYEENKYQILLFKLAKNFYDINYFSKEDGDVSNNDNISIISEFSGSDSEKDTNSYNSNNKEDSYFDNSDESYGKKLKSNKKSVYNFPVKKNSGKNQKLSFINEVDNEQTSSNLELNLYVNNRKDDDSKINTNLIGNEGKQQSKLKLNQNEFNTQNKAPNQLRLFSENGIYKGKGQENAINSFLNKIKQNNVKIIQDANNSIGGIKNKGKRNSIIKEERTVETVLKIFELNKKDEEILKKYSSIENNSMKIQYNFIKAKTKELVEKDFFGDFALDSTNKKRTATVKIAEEGTLLSFITKDVYNEYIYLKIQKIIMKNIQMLNSLIFFKPINSGFFQKNYFKYFELKKFTKSEIILDQNQSLTDVFYLKEGKVDISLNTNIFDIQKIMNDILVNLITNNNLSDSEFKRIEELDVRVISHKNFMKEQLENLLQKKTVNLFSLQNSEMSCLEPFLLGLNSFYRVIAVSEKVVGYQINSKKFGIILEENPECKASFERLVINKCIVVLSRLNDIKQSILNLSNGKFIDISTNVSVITDFPKFDLRDLISSSQIVKNNTNMIKNYEKEQLNLDFEKTYYSPNKKKHTFNNHFDFKGQEELKKKFSQYLNIEEIKLHNGGNLLDGKKSTNLNRRSSKNFTQKSEVINKNPKIAISSEMNSMKKIESFSREKKLTDNFQKEKQSKQQKTDKIYQDDLNKEYYTNTIEHNSINNQNGPQLTSSSTNTFFPVLHSGNQSDKCSKSKYEYTSSLKKNNKEKNDIIPKIDLKILKNDNIKEKNFNINKIVSFTERNIVEDENEVKSIDDENEHDEELYFFRKNNNFSSKKTLSDQNNLDEKISFMNSNINHVNIISDKDKESYLTPFTDRIKKPNDLSYLMLSKTQKSTSIPNILKYSLNKNETFHKKQLSFDVIGNIVNNNIFNHNDPINDISVDKNSIQFNNLSNNKSSEIIHSIVDDDFNRSGKQKSSNIVNNNFNKLSPEKNRYSNKNFSHIFEKLENYLDQSKSKIKINENYNTLHCEKNGLIVNFSNNIFDEEKMMNKYNFHGKKLYKAQKSINITSNAKIKLIGSTFKNNNSKKIDTNLYQNENLETKASVGINTQSNDYKSLNLNKNNNFYYPPENNKISHLDSSDKQEYYNFYDFRNLSHSPHLRLNKNLLNSENFKAKNLNKESFKNTVNLQSISPTFHNFLGNNKKSVLVNNNKLSKLLNKDNKFKSDNNLIKSFLQNSSEDIASSKDNKCNIMFFNNFQFDYFPSRSSKNLTTLKNIQNLRSRIKESNVKKIMLNKNKI